MNEIFLNFFKKTRNAAYNVIIAYNDYKKRTEY